MRAIKVVDLFKTVTEKVSLKLTPKLSAIDSTITGVHYMHGHPIEIMETLAEMDKSQSAKFKRYPLIALFQDFPERYYADPEIQAEGTFHLIIARRTNNTYKVQDRYLKNFDPFLYPIYEEFLTQLFRSGFFMLQSDSLIQHTKYDRLYWGRESLFGGTANMFNDYLDVIEIRDLKLKFYVNNCIKNVELK